MLHQFSMNEKCCFGASSQRNFFSRNKADVMKDASQDNEKRGQCLRRARKLVSAVQRDQEEVLQRSAE
jgi:hypothetical protein